jgi:DNA excision repair protein ERCC-6
MALSTYPFKEGPDSQIVMDADGAQREAMGGKTVDTAMSEQSRPLTESDRLKVLQTEVRDQDDLERDIGRQADMLLFEQANARDQQRMQKTISSKDKLETQIRKLRERVSQPIGTTHRAKLKNDIDRFQTQLDELIADLVEIEDRMDQRRREAGQVHGEGTSSGRLANESQRDYLIRTGKITPFSKFGLATQARSASNLQDALLDAEEEPPEEVVDLPEETIQFMSHRNLRRPGFRTSELLGTGSGEEYHSDRPKKRKKLPAPARKTERRASPIDSDASAWSRSPLTSAAEDTDILAEEDESESMPGTKAPEKRRRKTRGAAGFELAEIDDLRGVDDGNESVYQSRMKTWSSTRREARRRAHGIGQEGGEEAGAEPTSDGDEVPDESHMPHPEVDDTRLNGGYKIPGDIYPSLFDYQKTGVQWLWELYSQQVGGIIGDEMGLGKTIQVIAFLAGLQYSNMLTKPIIVVCPATVMKQWVNEFHRWWPPFRVTILHSSGSGMINLQRESTQEERLLEQIWDPTASRAQLTAGQKSARKVLKPILEHGGVLVTTYSGLQTYAPLLIPVDWQYAILDEGHKIRNPNTAITIYCKELRTPNRVILSGTPMQNNLVELWSLFDFVFPMRLGTLVNFRTQFEIPIKQGGYANASNLQVQTALRCAETLKDAISPYLLQRFKVDVAADLPKKSEQVLFCRLTKLQRKAYEDFLSSDDMKSILNGKRQVLYGIDILRKICNHPDLQDHKTLGGKPGYDYGNPAKSGKMQVVGSLLELWKDNGHKTLLFAQHRIMLDILEKYIKSMQGFKYRRMDGNTPIPLRQSMVDEFNNNPSLHVFLLTTKVGGLGINLTGADRVIIYDPDWNPSTDLQARERAWRLGQKREVTIYRLMTAGTIEEKIYHRQIFKQFLINKILKDPKQRQTFHLSDLHDLFTLTDEKAPTETSTLFKDAEVKYSAHTSKRHSEQPRDGRQDVEKEQIEQDLDKVPGIRFMEQFAGDANEQKQAAAQGSTNSESRVMEGIFARSGIHSAVEHDQIVGGKRVITADPQMIEQEARKVAAEAAKELRRAGEVARMVPVGTPTWTGQFGVSGKPQEVSAARAFGGTGRNRGGPSSSSLLAGLQRAQGSSASIAINGGGSGRGSETPTTAGSTTGGSRPETPTPTRGRDFGKLIRDYLMAHGGSVHTQMLIDHFNRYCTTPQATMEFKETLKAIATLDKGSRARGKWVLKAEYRPSH